MSEPTSYSSATENFSLPLLFAGQAQKEFFLNQALAMIDGILRFAVEETASSPPPSPAEGTCYRIAEAAEGEWAGKDNFLALRLAGVWHYVQPADGMQVFDRQTRQFILYDGIWVDPTLPADPTGGSVIDIEARASIAQLLLALRNAGIFAA